MGTLTLCCLLFIGPLLSSGQTSIGNTEFDITYLSTETTSLDLTTAEEETGQTSIGSTESDITYSSTKTTSLDSTTAEEETASSYTSSDTCGGQLMQFSGEIHSPLYPNYFPAHSYCLWEIQTFPGYRIELRFQHFDLEPHPACVFDLVTIYDGVAGQSPLLGHICQNGYHTFYSSSNIMAVEFRGYSAIQHTGFLAVYSSFYYNWPDISTVGDYWATQDYTTVADYWITQAAPYECGGELTSPTGTFTSPFFPGLYPDNSYCIWEIRALPDHIIELNFLHFDLESEQQCRFDSVTIYDGQPLRSSQLGKFCSSVTATITSTSNVMSIVFQSDGSVRKPGFQAVYTSSPRNLKVNCGEILTNSWGKLESPFYPNSHRPAECIWHIQAPSNQRVQLYFSDFALESSQLCSTEFVSVYDGTPLGSSLLGKYCGSVYPHFTSSSNSLSVVYSSRGNHSSSVRGFNAYYYFTYGGDHNVTLSCYSDHMEIRISASYLSSLGYAANDVFLNDPGCRPHVFGNWLQFDFQFNQCGTTKQGNADSISYSNILVVYHSSQIIQRTKKLSYNLSCQMYQNTMVEVMYNANDAISENVLQHGLYSASLSLYSSASFLYPVNQFPFYVQLSQNLYLQATLHSSDLDLMLFVDTCVASPDQYDFVTKTYDLIRKGCIKDSTYSTYSSPQPNKARFGFSAFSFANNFSTVYLKCTLTICQKYDYNSRCHRGCIARRKRNADPQKNEQVTVTLGPVMLQ